MTIGVVVKMSDDVNKQHHHQTTRIARTQSQQQHQWRFDGRDQHNDDHDSIVVVDVQRRRGEQSQSMSIEEQRTRQRKNRQQRQRERRTGTTMVFAMFLVVSLSLFVLFPIGAEATKFSLLPNANQHKDVIRMLNSDTQRKLLPTLDKLAGYYEYYESQKAESDGDSPPSKGEDTEQEYYYNTTLVVEEINGTVVDNPEEHYYYSHAGGPEGTPEPEGEETESSSPEGDGDSTTKREWEECVSEQMTATECEQHILDSLGGSLDNHEIPDLQIKFHHQRTPEQLSSSYWMYGVSTNIFGRVDCHTNHGQSIYAFQWETSEGTYDLPPVVCPKGGDAVACCQQFISVVSDMGIPTTDINGNCLSCWVHQEPLVPMKDPAASSADTNGESEDDDDVVYLAHDYDDDGMCVEKILTKQQVQGLDAEVHMDLESKLMNTLNMLLSAPSDEESPGASCLEVREATVAMERYGGNYPHSMTKMTGLFCGQCIEGDGEEFIHLSNHQRSMLEFILEDIAKPAKSDDHCIVIYTDHTGQNILSIPNVGGKRNTNIHQFTNEPPAVPTAPSPTTPTMPTVSVPTIIRPTIQIGTPPTDDSTGMPDEHGCLSHEKYNADTQDCVERCDKDLEQVWDEKAKECVPMCPKIGEIWSIRDMECVPRCNMSDGEIYDVEVDDCVPLCDESIGEVFDANVPGCVFLCSSHEGQQWDASLKTCVSICDATQGLAFAPDAPSADENGCIYTCDGLLGLMFDPLSPKADVNGCVQICDPMMGYIFNPSEGSMADEDGCVALCNEDEGYKFMPDDPMANEHGCIMIDIVVDCPEGYEYHPEAMMMTNMTNSTDMCVPICEDHQMFDIESSECVPRCSRSDGFEYDPEDDEADPETGCAPICRVSENKRQATQDEMEEGLAGTMGCMTLCDEGLVYYPDASTANDYGCVPYCTTKEDGMMMNFIYDPANSNADPDTGCVSICDPSMGLTYMPEDPQANSQGCMSVCQDDPSVIWSMEEQECVSICDEGYEYNPDSDEADSNGCVRSGIEPGGGLGGGEGDEECDIEQGEIYDPENPDADPATGCLLLCDPSEGLIYDHHPDMPEDSGCISVCVDDSSTRWSKSQDKCVPICEAEDGEVYMPDHPDADKDETSSDYGCVSVCIVEYPNGSHVWSTEEQACVAKCAQDGFKYMPDDESADDDGCVPICLESDGLKWPSSDEEATDREDELTPQGCLPICDDMSQMYDMETGNCIPKCDLDNEGLLYDPNHPDSDPFTGCVSKCIVNNPTKQLAWNTSSKTCKYICGKPLVSGEKYHVESDTCVPICDESTGVKFDPEASNADPETGCVPICNEEDGQVFDSNKKECVSVCDDDPSKIYSETEDKCVPLCDESEGKTFNGSGCSPTCAASDGLKFSKTSYEDDPEKPCVPLCDESKGEVFDESTEGCTPLCDMSKGVTFDSDSGECVDLCLASDGLKFSIESYEDDPEKPCVSLCDESLGETFDGTDSCEPLCDISKGLVFDLDEEACVDICMATEGLQFSLEAYEEDPEKPCVPLCDESIGETFDGTDGCKPLCDEMKGETFDSDSGECIDICLASDGLQFSLQAYEDPDIEDPCVPLCDESKGLTFDEASENCIDTCDETTGVTFDIDSAECIDICDESKGLTFSLEAYEDPDVTDPCVPLCDESVGKTFDEESGECVDTCDLSKGFQFDSDSGECIEICDGSTGQEYDPDADKCIDICDSSLGQEWDVDLQGCTSVCNTDEGLTFDVGVGECVDICNADFGLIYDPLHVNASDEGCAPICDENDGVIFNPDASWADTKGCIPICDDGYEPIPLENPDEDGYVRRLQTLTHKRTLKSNKRSKFIRGATMSSTTRYPVHPQRKMKEHAYVVPRSHQRRTSESNRLCRAVCDGSKGQIYDVETEECVSKCTSEDEIYDETLEECIPNCDSSLGLAYDSVEGTCVCDESKHLTHHTPSDSCICDEANGYTFDPFTTEDDNDHKCITICDSTKGQFYDSTLDTCQYQCDIKEGLAYNVETEECDPICGDGEDTDCISSDVVCEEAMGLTFDSDLSECVYICNPLEGLEYDVTSQECTSICDTEAGEIYNTVKQVCEPDCPNDGEYYLNDECINPCSDVSGDVHFDQVTNTCMCNNSEESIFYQSSDTTMAICGICDSSIGEELIDPSQLVGNDVVEFPDVVPKYPTCECYIIGASISQDTGKCSCKDQYYAVALEGNLDYYYGYNNGRPLCLIENYYNDAFEEFKFTPDYITA